MFRKHFKKNCLSKQNRIHLSIGENDLLDENSFDYLKRTHKSSKFLRCRRIWKRMSKLSVADDESTTSSRSEEPEDITMDLSLTPLAVQKPYFLDSINEHWASKACLSSSEDNLLRHLWPIPSPRNPISFNFENKLPSLHPVESLKDFLLSAEYRRNEISYFNKSNDYFSEKMLKRSYDSQEDEDWVDPERSEDNLVTDIVDDEKIMSVIGSSSQGHVLPITGRTAASVLAVTDKIHDEEAMSVTGRAQVTKSPVLAVTEKADDEKSMTGKAHVSPITRRTSPPPLEVAGNTKTHIFPITESANEQTTQETACTQGVCQVARTTTTPASVVIGNTKPRQLPILERVNNQQTASTQKLVFPITRIYNEQMIPVPENCQGHELVAIGRNKDGTNDRDHLVSESSNAPNKSIIEELYGEVQACTMNIKEQMENTIRTTDARVQLNANSSSAQDISVAENNVQVMLHSQMKSFDRNVECRSPIAERTEMQVENDTVQDQQASVQLANEDTKSKVKSPKTKDNLPFDCKWIKMETPFLLDNTQRFKVLSNMDNTAATENTSTRFPSFLSEKFTKKPPSSPKCKQPMGLHMVPPGTLPIFGEDAFMRPSTEEKDWKKVNDDFFSNLKTRSSDYFNRWPHGYFDASEPHLKDVFNSFQKIFGNQDNSSTIGDNSYKHDTCSEKGTKEDRDKPLSVDLEVSQPDEKEMTVEFKSDPPSGRQRRCIFSYTNSTPTKIASRSKRTSVVKLKEAVKPAKEQPKKAGTTKKTVQKSFSRSSKPDLRDSKNSLKELLTPKLASNFRVYCKQKSSLKTGVVITKYRSSIWLSDAGLLDSAISKSKADKIFEETAGMKLVMNIHDYVRYITKIALGSKLRPQQIVEQLSSCSQDHLAKSSKHGANKQAKSAVCSSDSDLPVRDPSSSSTTPTYTCSTPGFLIH